MKRWLGLAIAGLFGSTLCLALTASSAAQEPDPGAPPAFELPRWRLSVRAHEYGYADYSGMIGVYRRLSTHYDLGLQMTTRTTISSSDTDRLIRHSDRADSERDEDSDLTSLGFGFSLEARKWTPLAERLAFLRALRCTFSHSRSESDNQSESLDGDGIDRSWDERISESSTVVLALVLGAELELIPHLSAAMTMVPLALSATWSREDQQSTDFYDGGEEWRTDVSDDWDRSLQLETSFTGAVYVSFKL